MAIIKTGRNVVYAYDPEPGDAFVEVTWHGPPEPGGKHLVPFGGRPQPIENYQQAVDWAVSMADQMVFPLYVVPLTVDRAFPPERLQRLAAGMTDQERGDLRRLVVTTCAEVMRDCDEIQVREEAFGVLAKMGVIQP